MPQLRRLGLGELDGEHLLALRQDQALCWLLQQTTDMPVAQLLDVGSERPDLDQAITNRLRSAEDQALSEELYRTVVLDRAGAQRRLTLALSIVTLTASRLTPEHQRAIFTSCLHIVGRPANPYDSTAALISGSARQAASALLAIDSSLDDEVLEALSDVNVRANVQALVASALKERPDYASERLVRYLPVIASSGEAAIRFAEDCDADRSSLRPVVRARPNLLTRALAHMQPARPGSWFWYLAATVLPPAGTLALALVCRHATGAIATIGIEPGVAIGALALLAAVHVLSVQLAAQRLPGPIAAGSVASPVTVGAYLSGVLMLLCTILGKETPAPTWNPALVAGGLLVIVVVLAIASTLLSLRATTIAAATESVGRRKARQARRSGRRVGRLHRRAVETHELLDEQPSLRQFTSPQETAHRVRILARSTGYVRVDPALLASALSAAPWREGDIRLDLLVQSGVSVNSDHELASIVPAAGAEVNEPDIVAVERAFATREERPVERCAELCVTLCSQLPLLVRLGDPGGASRVLEVLLALLDAHVSADTREWQPRDGIMLLSPVVVQTVNQALADMKAARADAEREMSARLLRRMLERSRKDDGLVTLLAVKLSGAETLTELVVLYSAGCRAALTRSNTGILATQLTFDKLTPGSEDTHRYANEYAARLVLYCAAVAPRLSRAAWSRWWKASAASPAGDTRTLAARIGAGALPVGNLSLAVEVSLALRRAEADFDAMTAATHAPERAQFERFLSESYGRLLGSEAEQRIAEFLSFAKSVCATVPPE